MKHRRIMKMNKIIRGGLGIYKCEMIFEYSEVLQNWVMWPTKWYNAR